MLGSKVHDSPPVLQSDGLADDHNRLGLLARALESAADRLWSGQLDDVDLQIQRWREDLEIFSRVSEASGC